MRKQSEEQIDALEALRIAIKRCQQAGVKGEVVNVIAGKEHGRVYISDEEKDGLIQRLTKTVDELTVALKEEREEVETQVSLVDMYIKRLNESRMSNALLMTANAMLSRMSAGMASELEQVRAELEQVRAELQGACDLSGALDMAIAGSKQFYKERDEARAWARNLLKQRDYWKNEARRNEAAFNKAMRYDPQNNFPVREEVYTGDHRLCPNCKHDISQQPVVCDNCGNVSYQTVAQQVSVDTSTWEWNKLILPVPPLDVPGQYVDIDPKDVRLCSLCDRPMTLFVTTSSVDDTPKRHYFCEVCNYVEH